MTYSSLIIHRSSLFCGHHARHSSLIIHLSSLIHRSSLFVFLFFCTTAFTQSTWNYLPQAPVSPIRIDDVFFINDHEGWCASGAGAIHHTKDGGATWEQQFNAGSSQYYFRCIEFRDSLLGFAGTLNSRLFRTQNGGVTWVNVASQIQPTPGAICGVDIADSTTVYAVGQWDTPGFFLKSVDKGLTWTHKNMAQWSNGLVEIQFTSRDTGFVSGRGPGGGVILYTTDGGENWTKVFDSESAGEYVWKLQQVTEQVWIASIQTWGASGRMVKSLDGGHTWFTLPAPLSDMQGIGFVTPDHGWCGGYGQGFYETTDGGNTWAYNGFGGNYNRIFVLDSTLAYASGNSIYKFSGPPVSGITPEEKGLEPIHFTIQPNPSSGRITAVFELKQPSLVRITILNSAGQEQKQVLHDRLEAGQHTIPIDAHDLAPGNWMLGMQLNHGLHARPFVIQR